MTELFASSDGPLDAPPLLLIHGTAASSESWSRLVPLLTPVHRVVRVDLLGCGRSPSGAVAQAVRPGFDVPRDAIDQVRAMTFAAFAATSVALRAYLTEAPLPARLAPLGKPLLVLFGTEDQRWNPTSANDYLAVPGAEVTFLPGAGHTPIVEAPTETAKLLLDFAAALDPDKTSDRSPTRGD